VLAARRGGLASHDALTEALWPQRPPHDPAANLGALVNRARRALGHPAAVRTEDGGYTLGATVVIDVEVFLDAVAAAREAAAATTTGEHRHAARAY
jgi:DNA-binding SARP family transcriptional activator